MESDLVDFSSGSTDSAINFSGSADLHTPIHSPLRERTFVAKVDPLSTIRNKLIAQAEKLETSAKLRVFVSNISSPRLKRRYTRAVD